MNRARCTKARADRRICDGLEIGREFETTTSNGWAEITVVRSTSTRRIPMRSIVLMGLLRLRLLLERLLQPRR
jgi:hypothetical protein